MSLNNLAHVGPHNEEVPGRGKGVCMYVSILHGREGRISFPSRKRVIFILGMLGVTLSLVYMSAILRSAYKILSRNETSIVNPAHQRYIGSEIGRESAIFY